MNVNPDFSVVTELVRTVAREEVLPRFGHEASQIKSDGSVVTEVDFAVQRRLGEALNELTPGVPLLGEEMTAEQQRMAFDQRGSGLWCLDPLDGTSNFVSGIPFFSVSLALLDRDGSQFGVVYDPVRDECFSAVRGRGACLNGAPWIPEVVDQPLAQSIAIVDTKRLGRHAGGVLIDPPYRSQRCFGSGALEWCWLAARRGQVYLHGRQYLWDYAAGWLILDEMNGRASSFDGSVSFGADLSPRSVVAASTSDLFDEVWAWFRRAVPDGTGVP